MTQNVIKKEDKKAVDQTIVTFFDLLARFDHKDQLKKLAKESQRKKNPLPSAERQNKHY